MAGAHQVLAAVLDPLDRAPQPARQEWNQQVFRVDVSLEAEAAADIERNAAYARFRKPQDGGRLAAHPMNDLGGRPDGHAISPRIVDADDAAAFHRRGGIAVVMESALQLVRGARERGRDVALADGEGANEVGRKFVVDDRSTRAQRQFRVDHGRQGIEVEGDQLRRIFGGVAALRHDDRDGLADMPDFVMSQQRLLGIDELVLDERGPFARQRKLRVRHRRQELEEVRAAEHAGDTWRRGGARQVHAANARVCDRASDENRVQHVRQVEISDELSAAGQQAVILAARHGAADERRFVGIAHLRKVISGVTRYRLASRRDLRASFLIAPFAQPEPRLARYERLWPTKSNHSSSLSTATPRSLALPSFEPAPGPATT